ncbi:hypothetical protein [Proteiniphilum sp.]|uniref:hypothetical protein n=1 Tax=Proteiniphilum sp. TaxID=1926877 RepID=UPI003318AC78
MKNNYLIKTILCFCFIASLIRVEAQDHIACLGNGSLSIYEDRADIIQVFGPPYSAPSAMQIILDEGYTIISKREPGRAIWHYELMIGDRQIGRFTDFVVQGVPGFIREIHALDTIHMILNKPEGHVWTENTSNYSESVNHAIVSKTPSGSFYYGSYPITQDLYHQLLLKGNISIERKTDLAYRLICEPGKGYIYIAGANNYADNTLNAIELISESPGIWLDKTREYWDEFTNRRINFNEQLNHFPGKGKLLKTIDNIAILLKTQQSAEGAIIAGHNFHMGYIRDQYGASRGLLAMGYHKEAKDILNYYWCVWQKYGYLKNAQGIGMYGFHIHENDDVEITGYLIIQAFDYLMISRDQMFIEEILPMLEWCWKSQKKHLMKKMLPFNGDETYIAGNILPRTTIYDGSSEATLLFVTGGELLLEWIEKYGLWEQSRLEMEKKVLKSVKDAFADNFIDENGLMTNNPTRTSGEDLPAFRHGVCEARLQGCQVVDWTQKNENDRYLCPHCFPKTKLEKVEKTKFYIQSVTLTPFYLHSNLFDEKQKELFIIDLVSTYEKTKRMPSRPDGDITVGYDYGLFLYALTEQEHPLKDSVYNMMMETLDERGVWIEYYKENRPVMGTRYRPWESGINIDAAIRYALLYEHHHE